MGGIRNEYIRGKAQAETKLERRVQRMDSGYNEDRMWKRELPGGRERGHAGTDVTEEDVGIG